MSDDVRYPVVFRNPLTKARLAVDTKEGVERIERDLPNMWKREGA